MTVSGIASAPKSSGTCSGRNWAQNFSASTRVALPKPRLNRFEKVPARAAISRRKISPRSWASAITKRRISLPLMPAA